MSEDPIAALFCQIVQRAGGPVADDMARGLRAYHAAFRAIRDSAMNYEAHPEYQTHTFIARVPKDQLWPYTPHFRRFVGLAIQELFQTKLTSLGFSAVTMEQTLVFVDDHRNRWIVRMEGSDLEPATNQIVVYFPQSDTPLCGCTGRATPVEHLIDTTSLREAGKGLKTEDVGDWFALQ
jgi:hypothetical protein